MKQIIIIASLMLSMNLNSQTMIIANNTSMQVDFLYYQFSNSLCKPDPTGYIIQRLNPFQRVSIQLNFGDIFIKGFFRESFTNATQSSGFISPNFICPAIFSTGFLVNNFGNVFSPCHFTNFALATWNENAITRNVLVELND